MNENINTNEDMKKNFIQIVNDIEKFKNSYVDEKYNCLIIEVIKENYKTQIMELLNKYKEEKDSNLIFVPDYVFDNLIYELKSDFVVYNEKMNKTNDDKLDSCSVLLYNGKTLRYEEIEEIKKLLNSIVNELSYRIDNYNTTMFIENFMLLLKQYLYKINPDITRADIESLNLILKEDINSLLKNAKSDTKKIYSKMSLNEEIDHDMHEFYRSIDESNKKEEIYNKKQLLVHAKFGLTMILADEIIKSLSEGIITDEDVEEIINSAEKPIFITEDDFRNRIKNGKDNITSVSSKFNSFIEDELSTEGVFVNNDVSSKFNSVETDLDVNSVFKYGQNGEEITSDNDNNLSIDDVFVNDSEETNLENCVQSHNPELLKKAYSDLFNSSENTNSENIGGMKK